ncbi:MAG TPA: 50S ribosomal protein L11 methyltransferase [Kofleriaceae bacterium]|nr:50S ribosomal protein L11 methyltransferase [Kofleriaceae bacterium]
MVEPGAGDDLGESAAEQVAALLATVLPDAAAGVEVRAGEVVFWVPRERGPAAELAARSAAAELAGLGQPIDPARVASRPAAPEAEWRDAWKRYFRTVRLTRQIVVVPSWDAHDPGPEDRVVHLDPGQAFGTGAHASTLLVLRALQSLADRGIAPRRVLDLGTGSGILALAAAALWPEAEVVAVDSDPVAVDVARENAAANRASTVHVSGADLGALDGQFDVALANIQADVLAELAAPLCRRVGQGGWLVLSGLLSEQAVPVAGAYERQGMVIEAVRVDEEDPAWSAVLLRCSAS